MHVDERRRFNLPSKISKSTALRQLSVCFEVDLICVELIVCRVDSCVELTCVELTFL